jgi:anti-sigma B factor antagonist
MTTAEASPACAPPAPETERRRRTRFRCRIDVECRARTGPGAGDACPAKVRNLSALGACVVLDRRWPARSLMRLSLTHRWRQYHCEPVLRVVYTIGRDDGTYLVGGAFTRPLSAEESAGLLPGPSQGIEAEEVGEAIVAKFPPYSRLDEEAVQGVDEQLGTLADNWGDRPFVLDLRRVAGLNGSMLSQLVRFNQRVSRAGGRLALCGVAPQVGAVLDRVRLARYFRIYATEQEALQAV